MVPDRRVAARQGWRPQAQRHHPRRYPDHTGKDPRAHRRMRREWNGHVRRRLSHVQDRQLHLQREGEVQRAQQEAQGGWTEVIWDRACT